MPFDDFDMMETPGVKKARKKSRSILDDETLRGLPAEAVAGSILDQPPKQVTVGAGEDGVMRGDDAARVYRMLVQGTDEPQPVVQARALSMPAGGLEPPAPAAPLYQGPTIDRTLNQMGDLARQEQLARDFVRGRAETGLMGVQSRQGILAQIDPGNQLSRQGFFPEDNLRSMQIQQGQINQAQQDQAQTDRTAVEREKIAADMYRWDKQYGEKAGNDQFKRGVLATLVASPAYQQATPEQRIDMEAEALRVAKLGSTFGTTPPAPYQPGPTRPGATPRPLDPAAGAGPPPAAAGPFVGPPAPGPLTAEDAQAAELKRVKDEATKKALANQPINNAMARIKSAITANATTTAAPGQPASTQTTYGYDPTRGGDLLDAFASSGLTPEQQQNLMSQLATMPGVDFQQLGDALSQAAAGAMFATTPQQGGGQGMPATIPSPDIPGFAVGGGDDLGYSLGRWLKSGFNPGAMYDTISYQGRTIPLPSGMAGFQRGENSLIEAEKQKNRIRAAATLLPFLNSRGLYGNQPMPR